MMLDYSISSRLHNSPVTCGLCRRRFISGDGDDGGDVSVESSMCGDCKFLLLEDHGSLNQRTLRRRRSSGSSSIDPWADDTPGSSSQNSDNASSESESVRWNMIFSDTDIDTLSNSSTCTSPSSIHLNYYDTDSEIDPMHAYSLLNSEAEEDTRRVVRSVDIASTTASLSRIDDSGGYREGPYESDTGGFEETVSGFRVVCVICREDFGGGDDGERLPCSHLYHHDCISEWLRTRNSCPICRYELPVERFGRWRVRLATTVAPILSISAVGIVIGLSLKRWQKGGGSSNVVKKRGGGDPFGG